MSEETDYAQLRFVGRDPSISANLFHPEGVLEFEDNQLGIRSIILRPPRISIPKSEFDKDMKDLEEKIRRLEGSSLCGEFYSERLYSMRTQYEAMQKLKAEIEGGH